MEKNRNLPKVYAASRASIFARKVMWRDLRNKGANIISSWIDSDEDMIDFSALWVKIVEEIKICDRLVLYIENEDFPLKGALIEAGIAIGLGKPVFIVAKNLVIEEKTFRPLGSWAGHSLVKFVENIESAVFEINPLIQSNLYTKNIKYINVAELNDMELDFWVIQSLGKNVLGKAYAYYNPEDGQPVICHENISDSHLRYFYVEQCNCNILHEIELDLQQEMLKDYPNYKLTEKILGHYPLCLSPVLNYSSDSKYVGEFLSEFQISLNFKDNKWIATLLKDDKLISMMGTTVSLAVMRTVVASEFGTFIKVEN